MAKKDKSEKQEVATRSAQGELAQPRQLLSPFDEMERLFEEFVPRGLMQSRLFERPLMRGMEQELARAPRVDVIDHEDEILVRAEVPGVAREDLEVSLSDGAVTIKGHNRREEKAGGGDYHRWEISQGSFARSVALPAEVDPDKAKASLDNGVLELTLPKRAQAKRRRIEVK